MSKFLHSKVSGSAHVTPGRPSLSVESRVAVSQTGTGFHLQVTEIDFILKTGLRDKFQKQNQKNLTPQALHKVTQWGMLDANPGDLPACSSPRAVTHQKTLTPKDHNRPHHLQKQSTIWRSSAEYQQPLPFLQSSLMPYVTLAPALAAAQRMLVLQPLYFLNTLHFPKCLHFVFNSQLLYFSFLAYLKLMEGFQTSAFGTGIWRVNCKA